MGSGLSMAQVEALDVKFDLGRVDLVPMHQQNDVAKSFLAFNESRLFAGLDPFAIPWCFRRSHKSLKCVARRFQKANMSRRWPICRYRKAPAASPGLRIRLGATIAWLGDELFAQRLDLRLECLVLSALAAQEAGSQARAFGNALGREDMQVAKLGIAGAKVLDLDVSAPHQLGEAEIYPAQADTQLGRHLTLAELGALAHQGEYPEMRVLAMLGNAPVGHRSRGGNGESKAGYRTTGEDLPCQCALQNLGAAFMRER